MCSRTQAKMSVNRTFYNLLNESIAALHGEMTASPPNVARLPDTTARVSTWSRSSQTTVWLFPLNCGGSHTVISPIQLCTSQQDRKHRIQTQVGIMTHPKRGDIMRVEKNNFKGSLNTPARRYTETKRPPISTKVSMGKTEDKAKYSLSHKSPAQVDFLSIPSPVIVSKMTLQPRATSKATTRWRQRGSIAVQDSKVTKG